MDVGSPEMQAALQAKNEALSTALEKKRDKVAETVQQAIGLVDNPEVSPETREQAQAKLNEYGEAKQNVRDKTEAAIDQERSDIGLTTEVNALINMLPPDLQNAYGKQLKKI